MPPHVAGRTSRQGEGVASDEPAAGSGSTWLRGHGRPLIITQLRFPEHQGINLT